MSIASDPEKTPQQTPDECLRCGEPITSLGVEQFRVGGTSGGWKLVFGDLAELGEGMLEFEIFGCRACGHVELRRPGFGPPPESTDPWTAVWQAHDRPRSEERAK